MSEPRNGGRKVPDGDVRESVDIPTQPSFWKRLFAFVGPAYLISVGYMDPGNWATDIGAGSRYGYKLLWVLLMSNLMAVLLQSLSARLGIVTRMDLAQACRAMFGRRTSVALWILAEIAIVACDLAEVLGSAIGLELLFGLPLLAGVLITALDSLILLILHSRGVRMMEAFIVALVVTIGMCLGLEVLLSRPDWSDLATGFVPMVPDRDALYLATAILGATVMPHNLYLHSALVQSRRIARVPSGILSAIRFNVIDSVVALNAAFFVNAALLVMAAATFYGAGLHGVTEIQDAHRLLEPILGAHIAPVAFAVALIASGQASTITGTLAGQIVMEGFVNIRLRPIARRLITRTVAILPAALTIVLFGEHATGELLVLSQVVLSLQLSFAVIPLIQLASDRRFMGQYAIRRWMRALSWLVAAVIVVLNLWMASTEISSWLGGSGELRWLLWITVLPGALGLGTFLVYITAVPWMRPARDVPRPAVAGVHGPIMVPTLAPPRAPRRIAAAVDFSEADAAVLSYAVTLALGAGRRGRVLLFHVVESSGARILGDEQQDLETVADRERLEQYATELTERGVEAAYDLGFGETVAALVELVSRREADLVVIGGHGHRVVGDFLRGTTVERLRHRLSVPVLVVPSGVVDSPRDVHG